MHPFSGTLSLDGHALGRVTGMIKLLTIRVETSEDESIPEAICHYMGAIEPGGYTPAVQDHDEVFRLDTDDGLSILICVMGAEGGTQFVSTGVPIQKPPVAGERHVRTAWIGRPCGKRSESPSGGTQDTTP